MCATEFLYQPIRVIDALEGFGNAGHVDRHGAVYAPVVAEIAAKGLDVAIEDQTDHLAFPPDHRRARIASDDVVRGSEIEIRVQIDSGLCRKPSVRQLEGGAAGRVGIGTRKVSHRGDGASVLPIPE